ATVAQRTCRWVVAQPVRRTAPRQRAEPCPAQCLGPLTRGRSPSIPGSRSDNARMESTEHRSAVGQLADDLPWLEEQCRQQPGLAEHAGTLRLASALTRNVIGPFLEGQPARPLHVAVVGGAGAGKSTVVNFLAGAVVAEANPQAGYTRHPSAYLPAGPAFTWPSYIGFMGPLPP